MMGRTVECLLCKKRCVLVEGQRGDCRVRINLNGKLMTLVYGKPCAVHVDPIEKKPLFHFLPATGAFSIATAGCNLHCKFCQNWQISQRPPEETQNYDLPPEKVVEAALHYNCRSIAYTYSEPAVFYEYVMDTAKMAQERGMRNVLVTAGYIDETPLRELCQYVDATNTDLKGFTEDYYREICGGELQPVLDGLRICKEEGVWVEMTNLVIPTLNDDMDRIGEMCRWIVENLGEDQVLHFSRFHPMYQLKNLPPTPAETLEEARRVAIEAGLNYVYIGNVPGHEGENTYCPNCKRLLVKRVGFSVVSYNLVEESCKFCGHKIAGVWS